MLDKKFIDTRNSDFDFDITKEFTWEFRDLVEIKKRKRVVDRVIQPTIASFNKLISADKRKQAIKRGALVTSLKPYSNFKMYEYYQDKFADDKEADQKALKQHELNVTNAGKEMKPARKQGVGRHIIRRK